MINFCTTFNHFSRVLAMSSLPCGSTQIRELTIKRINRYTPDKSDQHPRATDYELPEN